MFLGFCGHFLIDASIVSAFFRVSTFNFFVASEIWFLNVFADLFKCSVLPGLVHSQTVSVAKADFVVIRSPVNLSPVIVLCTLRHPEEKQWGEWMIRLKIF